MMLLSSPWAVVTWGVFWSRMQSAKECPGWPQMMHGCDKSDLLSEARAWTATLIQWMQDQLHDHLHQPEWNEEQSLRESNVGAGTELS